MENKRIVVVSGGFDPVHIGHVRMFKRAKELGDYLVVIVNNDNWLRTFKKNGQVFMSEEERVEVVSAFRWVDEVRMTEHVLGGSEYGVADMLEKIKPHIFANGGDRKNIEDIPEGEACKRLGIEMVFNVGDGGKVQSSSWLVQKSRARNNG